jgi:hypothetical protein
LFVIVVVVVVVVVVELLFSNIKSSLELFQLITHQNICFSLHPNFDKMLCDKMLWNQRERVAGIDRPSR